MNWREWLGLDPAKNPFLRLSEADRLTVGKKWLVIVLGAMLFFWTLSYFHVMGL